MSNQTLISPPFRWVAILGGVACLLAYWFFSVYGYYPVQRDIGPTAEIRFTPYHTAGKLLQLEETNVSHHRNLKLLNQPIIDVDTIVLAVKPGHINQKKLDNLIDWVKSGGHLFYWANRKTETDNDRLLNYLNAELIKDKIAEKDKEVEDLLELGQEVLPMLGELQASKQKPSIIQIENIDTNIQVGFNPTWHLLDYSGDAYYFAEDDKDHLLQYLFNDGSITIMSDMNVWNNANIADHEHGFFLKSMVPSGANNNVWFMFGGDHESALNKITKYAKPLFWLGLLFLVFWLWRQIPRVGPKLELNLYQRRNIGEHINASAQLRWQQKQTQQWLQSQAKKIFKQASIRNPGFSSYSREEQIAWLATIGSVDKDKLNYLYDQAPLEPMKELQFLELMHQLQQLKNRL